LPNRSIPTRQSLGVRELETERIEHEEMGEERGQIGESGTCH